MPWHLPPPIVDLAASAERVRRMRHGVLEVRQGRFVGLWPQPWPKLASHLGSQWYGAWRHRHVPLDVCRLYFNRPRRLPQFLVLAYVESGAGTSFRSFRRAVAMLDEVARWQQADALVCQVANARISDRLLSRWGWEAHCPSWRGRNFIKRFYGVYPISTDTADNQACEPCSLAPV